MKTSTQSDRIFLALRITNIVVLLFWLLYFVNGFLPTHNSVEVVKDFDEFNIAGPGGSSNTSYKKMVTQKRNFTVYTNENEFFTHDTLELKVTPIFGSVLQYRKISAGVPQEWMKNMLSRYTNTMLLTISIGLFLLSFSLVFFKMKVTLYKTLCLLSVIGALLFVFSVIS